MDLQLWWLLHTMEPLTLMTTLWVNILTPFLQTRKWGSETLGNVPNTQVQIPSHKT